MRAGNIVLYVAECRAKPVFEDEIWGFEISEVLAQVTRWNVGIRFIMVPTRTNKDGLVRFLVTLDRRGISGRPPEIELLPAIATQRTSTPSGVDAPYSFHVTRATERGQMLE
ncbi:hypothetical protein FJZ36_15585 [Candidatus Poribacteria bacterium]|nr:hypothetical protein [Candidatus Poribacteria bacterium]